MAATDHESFKDAQSSCKAGAVHTWNWNWPLFVRGDRHHPPQIDLSYSQTQRLIGYVQADDPAAAIAAARGQEAARQREQRRTAHSHICERRMAAPAEPATPHQAVAEVHQLAQEASRSEIGGASQIDGATGERIIELTPAAERDLETLKTLYLAAMDEVRLAFNAYTALERGDWQALATNPKLAAAAGELVREMSEAIRKLDAAA
jgi:hypothetical protein